MDDSQGRGAMLPISIMEQDLRDQRSRQVCKKWRTLAPTIQFPRPKICGRCAGFIRAALRSALTCFNHFLGSSSMSADTKPPSLLQQRQIEANMVGPLVRAFSAE